MALCSRSYSILADIACSILLFHSFRVVCGLASYKMVRAFDSRFKGRGFDFWDFHASSVTLLHEL